MINSALIKTFFKDASEKITNIVPDVCKKEERSETKDGYHVGGISHCKIIQDNVKAKFPQCKVIVPEDVGLSVLKGADLFGHRPNYIISRLLRYTYGIRTNKNLTQKYMIRVD